MLESAEDLSSWGEQQKKKTGSERGSDLMGEQTGTSHLLEQPPETPDIASHLN